MNNRKQYYQPMYTVNTQSTFSPASNLPQIQYNIQNDYKKISEGFCKEYYSTYDNNFVQLGSFFKPESKITFLEEEMIGFGNLLQQVQHNYNIHNFHHKIQSIDSQPVGSMTILVTITGEIIVNNNASGNKFTETLILQQDQSNSFYVYHSIMRLME